jgi:hypothetical protein
LDVFSVPCVAGRSRKYSLQFFMYARVTVVGDQGFKFVEATSPTVTCFRQSGFGKQLRRRYAVNEKRDGEGHGNTIRIGRRGDAGDSGWLCQGKDASATKSS